ncbi:hypothetical protein [Methylorubrum thiocyanatum]|uniref:hypothetical protein n=1 Tax=Methylorubrum thiocyanatum TaxID=47958 RepID=UPI0035C7E5DE
MHTLITPKARDLAFSCASSDYHWQLLQGARSWTGADLQGLQAYGSNRRNASIQREHVLQRIAAAGLWWERTRGWRGRIVIVVMTERERRLGWDRPAEHIALAAIAKAAKAAAAAERKADRERGRARLRVIESAPA